MHWFVPDDLIAFAEMFPLVLSQILKLKTYSFSHTYAICLNLWSLSTGREKYRHWLVRLIVLKPNSRIRIGTENGQVPAAGLDLRCIRLYTDVLIWLKKSEIYDCI